jgi:hypothetical protein
MNTVIWVSAVASVLVVSHVSDGWWRGQVSEDDTPS